MYTISHYIIINRKNKNIVENATVDSGFKIRKHIADIYSWTKQVPTVIDLNKKEQTILSKKGEKALDRYLRSKNCFPFPALDVRRPADKQEKLVLGQGNTVKAGIVYPEQSGLKTFSQKIQRRIKAVTGIEVPMVSDSDNSLLQSLNHLIIVGGSHQNKMARLLAYCDRCLADMKIPGRSGTLIQTLHNVDNSHRNMMIIACDRVSYCTVLNLIERNCQKKDNQWILNHIHLIKLGPEWNGILTVRRCLEAIAKRLPVEQKPAELSFQSLRKRMKAGFSIMHRKGISNNPLVPSVVLVFRCYQLTGDKRFLRLFKDNLLDLAAYHLSTSGGASYISDYDKNLVIEERRKTVAKKITEFLKGTDRFSKTIVFCRDIEHAEAMRKELANQNSDLVKENYKYVMKITGDDKEGKRELDNFLEPDERYPVIATTSKLMTTGVDTQTCKLIVLDSNIRSMTEFKQIIGRGTRILEEYGKRYFTILDFRNVTDLFADPDFDGDPVRIKEVNQEEDISTIEDEEIDNPEIVIDEETGEEVTDFEDSTDDPSLTEYPTGDVLPPYEPPSTREPHKKVFVNGIDVTVLNERQMYFDLDGKPITTSLKNFTKKQLLTEYNSLDDFLQKWKDSDRKTVITKELEEHGVLVDDLLNAVNRDCDLFDIICHVAYDKPPLTRKERAERVKKRNYFTKYGETAKKVLEALLDKYADEGVEHIEDIGVLRIQPFSELGTPMQIVEKFGGKDQYKEAVKALEKLIYEADIAS